jgi:hypothetical protein
MRTPLILARSARCRCSSARTLSRVRASSDDSGSSRLLSRESVAAALLQAPPAAAAAAAAVAPPPASQSSLRALSLRDVQLLRERLRASSGALRASQLQHAGAGAM